MSTLRDYQTRCLGKSLERYQAGCNRQLAVLATGLGKTAIASSLRTHHGIQNKVLFLVHMEQLATQAADAIARWNPGLMVGVEMAGAYASPMDTFVVASVPTLGRKGSDRIRRFDPSEYGAVIQDEAHIGVSDSFKRVYSHFGLMEPNPAGPLFLGITATPNRADGQGLRELFDEIVFDMGIRDGIASGWLCDLRAIRVKTKTDISKVKTRAGDFAQDELANAVNTPERNGTIVKEWYKHAYGRRTLAFTVDIQHALDLAEAFKKHLISAEAVWGDDPERAEKIRKHKAGEIEVLCNCSVLGIGYDDPRVSCIISAAPTKSYVRYAQQVGRGTRIADGKEDCLVMDTVDNCAKHNLCNISTLLGLPKDLDLKGEKYTKAKEKMDRIAQEFPTANMYDIKTLSELDTMAEHVSLFQAVYPPEVSQLTELAWRKQGDGYWLSIDRERLTMAQDLLGEWRVKGTVKGKQIDIQAQNLSGAFNAADREVMASGGQKILLSRNSSWRSQPASQGQLDALRRCRIQIPGSITKEQASAALSAHFGRRS